MASVEIITTTQPQVHVHDSKTLVKAGSRLYWIGGDSTELVYLYSNDDGATWTGRTVISANEVSNASAVYDAVNGRLNICYVSYNSSSSALNFRAITSNVASGTPGALTTETVVDPATGGAGFGINYPQIIHSATGTNPRYWIIGQKWTAVTPTIETRVWFVAAGSAADTAGNWSPTNFTNLGANADTVGRHMGVGVWWTVLGVDKVTFVFKTNTTGEFEGTTFDPTAATPGSSLAYQTIASGYGNQDFNVNGAQIAFASKADYLAVGFYDIDDGMWDFYKTVNGTTWTQPDASWSNIPGGRGALTRSGNDFYFVYSNTFGAVATTASALRLRKITTSDDSMGAAVVFSDTDANGVSAPLDTGTDRIRAAYRSSLAPPYSMRYDSQLLSGQTLRPDADITTTGWTTAPLWSKLDEAVAAGDVVTATAS